MSALNKSTQIPSAIDTVEKMAAWCAGLLRELNPKIKIVESETVTTTCVQTSITQAFDGSLRYTVRMSLPLNPAFFSNDSKLWENIQELDTVTIPTAFTTNGA